MKRVCKTTNYAFGWADPRVAFGGKKEKPTPTYKRLVGDLETGTLNEYTNRYIHGAINGNFT
jgi:hypothetical protein